MTPPEPPAAAVEIARETLAMLCTDCEPEAVVTALAAAGLLVDPERLAALEAVAEAAYLWRWASNAAESDVAGRALAVALDAVPAAESTEP